MASKGKIQLAASWKPTALIAVINRRTDISGQAIISHFPLAFLSKITCLPGGQSETTVNLSGVTSLGSRIVSVPKKETVNCVCDQTCDTSDMDKIKLAARAKMEGNLGDLLPKKYGAGGRYVSLFVTCMCLQVWLCFR